jgi:hypothetical protein
MTLGLSLETFTIVHVIISLIGLVSGFVVLKGLLSSQRCGSWTALFLATTVLTSVTGFGFPFDHFLPSHWVGVISLVLLLFAILGLYVFGLAGAWRWIYVVCAVMALYLNAFVAVVQSFQKVSFLHGVAPTQSEPPFLVAQVVVLGLFVVAGIVAARRFHPAAAAG